MYVCRRNLARSQRRAGCARSGMEERARTTAKEYHKAVHRQQRAHWDDSLADREHLEGNQVRPAGGCGGDRQDPALGPHSRIIDQRRDRASDGASEYMLPATARIDPLRRAAPAEISNPRGWIDDGRSRKKHMQASRGRRPETMACRQPCGTRSGRW